MTHVYIMPDNSIVELPEGKPQPENSRWWCQYDETVNFRSYTFEDLAKAIQKQLDICGNQKN